MSATAATRKRGRDEDEEGVDELQESLNTITLGKRVRFTEPAAEEPLESVYDECSTGSESYKRTADGKKEGDYVAWYPTGQLRERATFRGGLEEGLVQQYYPGGGPFIVYNCVGGRRQGAAFRFYSNGVVCAQEMYRDDKEDGLATYYYQSGERQMEILFAAGKVVFVRHFESGSTPLSGCE
jgi:antitoxin component YwqK of YwqJK toxin-antitoxin module